MHGDKGVALQWLRVNQLSREDILMVGLRPLQRARGTLGRPRSTRTSTDRPLILPPLKLGEPLVGDTVSRIARQNLSATWALRVLQTTSYFYAPVLGIC